MTMEIQSYRFGEIVIDGKAYNSDVIIFPNRVRDSWWRKEGHRLQPEDVKEIIEFKPELLIIGTGASGCMQVPEDTVESIESKGIQLKIEKTGDACSTYNNIKNKGKVVAAFHLTC